MIEPCPFCGASGEDDIHAGMDEYRRTFMACSKCGAQGPFGGMMEADLTPTTYNLAVRWWNTRSPRSCVDVFHPVHPTKDKK